MHSSRMRTVRSSSRLRGGEGGLPQCMLGYPPPGPGHPQGLDPPGRHPPGPGPGRPSWADSPGSGHPPGTGPGHPLGRHPSGPGP